MRVRAVVDLSVPIDEQTQLYPGDPDITFNTAATIERDGFNLLRMSLGSQSGTNCDAPYHFLQNGKPIDEVDLALFAGPGRVIDVRGKPARAPIERADLAPQLTDLEPGTIVVLHTGWARHYRTERYFDHPFLSPDGCSALLEAGVRTVCLDALSVDETPEAEHPGAEHPSAEHSGAEHPRAAFPVHRMIAGVGGVIVENLTGIERVDFADPFIVVLPLRLTGADGSPTRAVALDLVS
jgi:kynurenine formamidase